MDGTPDDAAERTERTDRPVDRRRNDAFGYRADYVPLYDVYTGRKTAKAVEVHTTFGRFWVPLSVIKDPDGVRERADKVDLEVREWFALKAEMI